MVMLEKMKVQKSKKELLFSTEACLFQDYEATGDEEVNVESGNVRMQMVMAKQEQKVFRNLKTKQMIDQSDFMGKTFLIEDKAESLPWKITNETKEIAGYKCQQAIMINTEEEKSDTVIAWFTKQIPVPAGPMIYGQLPGMILGISQQGGNFQLNAISVVMEPIASDKFEMPTKGKKVNREQYEKLVKEKMSEMEEFQGGGQRMEIRIGH
jgi:GLPGLI family protein